MIEQLSLHPKETKLLDFLKLIFDNNESQAFLQQHLLESTYANAKESRYLHILEAVVPLLDQDVLNEFLETKCNLSFPVLSHQIVRPKFHSGQLNGTEITCLFQMVDLIKCYLQENPYAKFFASHVQ